jgi:heme/copper-type cytochrome/quinol oxidase subunit 3
MFLLGVLGWSLGTLFYSYFYLRLYSTEWPQGGLSPPEFVMSGLAFAAIPLGASAAWLAQFLLERNSRRGCLFALASVNGLFILFLGCHLWHLARLDFAPQTNAYGSIFFVLNWALDVIVLIGLGIGGTALVRLYREAEHWQLFLQLHVQMAAHYAYFAAGAAALVYAVLYLSPHVM